MKKIPIQYLNTFILYNHNMLKQCRKRLLRIKKSGTIGEKDIANKFLDMKDSRISKISQLANLFNVSNSSITRFAKALGYTSFKHFQFEFNSTQEEETWSSNKVISSFDFTLRHYEKAKEIAEKVVSKEIYIIPSKRSYSLGIMAQSRLLEIGVKCCVFEGDESEISKFIEQSRNGVLMLISLSGYSKLFSKSMQEINKNDLSQQVIIATAAKWMDIFNKYEFISLGNIKNSEDAILDSWEDYNNLMLELAAILMSICKELNQLKKKVNSN